MRFVMLLLVAALVAPSKAELTQENKEFVITGVIFSVAIWGLVIAINAKPFAEVIIARRRRAVGVMARLHMRDVEKGTTEPGPESVPMLPMKETSSTKKSLPKSKEPKETSLTTEDVSRIERTQRDTTTDLSRTDRAQRETTGDVSKIERTQRDTTTDVSRIDRTQRDRDTIRDRDVSAIERTQMDTRNASVIERTQREATQISVVEKTQAEPMDASIIEKTQRETGKASPIGKIQNDPSERSTVDRTQVEFLPKRGRSEQKVSSWSKQASGTSWSKRGDGFSGRSVQDDVKPRPSHSAVAGTLVPIKSRDSIADEGKASTDSKKSGSTGNLSLVTNPSVSSAGSQNPEV